MALNDSCHLLIETKHHFIQKSGGLEPLSPIASAATGLQGSATSVVRSLLAIDNNSFNNKK